MLASSAFAVRAGGAHASTAARTIVTMDPCLGVMVFS